jgi:hypothetical protein
MPNLANISGNILTDSGQDIALYTPNSRTLTINGTTYDLSANRSWTIDSTSASTRTVQKYTADGSSATYTVTGGYTVGLVDVYVNGIKLDNASGSEFTATNGTTVVLVSTPASGDIVEVYKYGSQFIATNALRQTTLFTATAGQNTFTVNYSVGLVDVFYNGSKLDSSEYTASNGTTIVFNTACVLNDKVEVVAYTYNATGYTGVAYSNTPTTNYLTKWTSTGTIGNSSIFDNGTGVGIGTTTINSSTKLAISAANTATDARGILSVNSNNAYGADLGGSISLGGENGSGSTPYPFGKISGRKEGGGAAYSGYLSFATTFSDGTITERMRITSTGNVGIGTNSPLALLDVCVLSSGARRLLINYADSIVTIKSANDSNNGENLRLVGDNITFNTGSSGNGTERMKISSTGVSAVTYTATDRFIVSANAGYRVNNNTDGVLGYMLRSGTWKGNSENNLSFATDGAYGISFFTNGTTSERMIVRDSGEVLMHSTTFNSANIGQLFGTGGDTYFTTNGQNTVWLNRLNSNGTMLLFQYNSVTTGSISTNSNSLPSDLNFKKDVSNISIGLDLVSKLRPVHYRHNFDDADEPLSNGIIAQELEQSLLECGIEKNSLLMLQHKPNEKEGESQYWVDYTKMIPVLIKSIQEQQAQISAQAIEIDNLKKLIN